MAKAKTKKLELPGHFLTDLVELSDPEKLLTYMEKKTGKSADAIVKEATKIGTYARENRLYYNVRGEKTEEDAPDVHYMLLDSGLTTPEGDELYFSCFLHKICESWIGAVFDTLDACLKRFEDYYNSTGYREDAKGIMSDVITFSGVSDAPEAPETVVNTPETVPVTVQNPVEKPVENAVETVEKSVGKNENENSGTGKDATVADDVVTNTASGVSMATTSEKAAIVDNVVKKDTHDVVAEQPADETKYTERVVNGSIAFSQAAYPEVDALTIQMSKYQDVLSYLDLVADMPNGGFTTSERLVTYLTSIEIYLCGLAKDSGGLFKVDKPCSGVVVDSTRRTVIINVGLLDSFAKPILLMATCSTTGSCFFSSVTIARCRDTMTAKGFSKELIQSVQCEKFDYFQTISQNSVFFGGTTNDVDLTNLNTLTHSLVDRLERLPDYMKVMPFKERCAEYVRRLRIAFNRNSIDPTYFKPVRGSEYGKLAYLIPFYVDDNPDNPLEFSAVLTKSSNDFWVLPTILNVASSVRMIRGLTPFAKI